MGTQFDALIKEEQKGLIPRAVDHLFNKICRYLARVIDVISSTCYSLCVKHVLSTWYLARAIDVVSSTCY